MSAIKRKVFKEEYEVCTCDRDVDEIETLCSKCKKEYESYLDEFFNEQTEENSIAAYWR